MDKTSLNPLQFIDHLLKDQYAHLQYWQVMTDHTHPDHGYASAQVCVIRQIKTHIFDLGRIKQKLEKHQKQEYEYQSVQIDE